MKKFRVIIMTCAILLAVGASWANKQFSPCTYSTQYIFKSGAYIEAGEYGYDYYCFSGLGYCTYYKPSPILFPNFYLPCRTGTYSVID